MNINVTSVISFVVEMEMDEDNVTDKTIVLDPISRLKIVTKQASEVEIDNNIPPIRYYKSGLQMVRMANVYLEEGALENAFTLYIKFMTLFLEKIRNHPEFEKVPKSDKQVNSQKLKEVLPKAEQLKKQLLAQYEEEYDRYLKDVKRREKFMRNKMVIDEKSKPSVQSAPAKNSVNNSQPLKLNINPVPPLLENLSYPNSDTFLPPAPFKNSSADKSDLKSSKPIINRSSKPSFLVCPNVPPSKLRIVIVPGNLVSQFLLLARKNTDLNIETGGILAGKLKREQLLITHLLVPEQVGTCDSCTTQREEDLFDYQEQHDLITLGWIHTHPTQTAFMSSVDLHTHYAYQRMIPEAIAIVCAVNDNNVFYCLTDYGLYFISNCTQTGFHPHPTDNNIYTEAKHIKPDPRASLEIVDLRRTKR